MLDFSILTQRHSRVHASMNSDCWKCKQACICLPAKDSDLWDLISIEKAKKNLVRWCFIWQWMHVFIFLHWFYSIHFINNNLVAFFGFKISCLKNNISMIIYSFGKISIMPYELALMKITVCPKLIYSFLFSKNVSSFHWHVQLWCMEHLLSIYDCLCKWQTIDW